MTKVNTRAWLALCLTLPACGQALVEFSDPGSTDSSTSGIGLDGGNTEPATSESSDTNPTDTDPNDTNPTDTSASITDLDGGDTVSTTSDNTQTDGSATDLDASNTDFTTSESSDTDPTDTTGFTTELDASSTDPTTSGSSDTSSSGTDLDAGNTIIVVPTEDASDGGDGGPGASDASTLDAGDITPPLVLSTDPAAAALDVSITKRLTVNFSEPMDDASLDTTSFTLQQGLTLIPGTVTYLPYEAALRFVPDEDLELDTLYTATLTTDATDVAGNPIGQAFVWSFRTSACALSLVNLGAADDFAVLGGSTVVSTGPTSVTGNLGVSPGTAIDGFPPGVIDGNQHAGDPTAAQAIADLTTAYNNAAGQTLCAVTVAGNLGGQTLTPGLYKSTSSLEISAGDLTLDALGDEDAVFIFQMASTLTTTSGRQVVLSGGAQASHVFWQVGTSATLGTTSAFQGTVMADQAITMNTDATLNGRLLARIAAVSLDSNTIVLPQP